MIFPRFVLSGGIETIISSHTIDQTYCLNTHQGLAGGYLQSIMSVPGCQAASQLRSEMEIMQEEADTETGPDILTSAEYASLESEGIALLTRQLQVNIYNQCGV